MFLFLLHASISIHCTHTHTHSYTHTHTPQDYLELVLQFGYVCLFVTAYPLVLPLALVSNYLETRVDAKKLATSYHRPIPLGASDIGSWYGILEMMVVIAVFTNCGLAVFSMNLEAVASLSRTGRVWTFNLLVISLLVVKQGLMWSIPDTPADVHLQSRRTDHVVSKVIHNVRDHEPHLGMAGPIPSASPGGGGGAGGAGGGGASVFLSASWSNVLTAREEAGGHPPEWVSTAREEAGGHPPEWVSGRDEAKEVHV